MESEDYFGDIPIPQDEDEEDAANDLTFGDIGDLKAGDETSDAAWKPDDHTLSSQIEVEREALARSRKPSADPPEPALSPLKHAPDAGPQVPSPQTTATAWSILQAMQALQQRAPPPVPSAHPGVQHVPPLSALMGSPQGIAPQSMRAAVPQAMSGGLPGTMPQPGLPVHIPAPMQHLAPMSVPPMHQPLHPQTLLQQQMNAIPPQQKLQPIRPLPTQDYQRTMLAYQEQQTRLLLQQHQDRADQQLREAERAQQAGITFDRAEFDRHQEARRRMILADHYERLRRIQFHAWQQSQQLLKQNTERSVEGAQSLDLRRNMNGDSHQSMPPPPRHYPSPPQHLASPVKPTVPPPDSVSSPPGPAASSPQQLPSPQSSIEAQLSRAFRAHIRANERVDLSASTVAKPRERREKRTEDEEDAHRQLLVDIEDEKAPRLLEIERQMAEAGLGPSSSQSGRSTDAFGMPMRELRSGSSGSLDKAGKKGNRRLESMTDRDQELVFRAHLRQIESSVLYKDDYYNSVLRRKKKLGTDKVFAELAERVQHLRLRAKEQSSNGALARVRGSKRKKDMASSDDHLPGSSPQHSSQNLRALANALGTVQSWNPRAPRRVMDFGLLEKRDPIDPRAPQKLLREDERVHVRMEIERGYDEIAVIHDIARGERQESLTSSLDTLFSTLHLEGTLDAKANKGRDKPRNTRFFATMCVIEKGRLFLSRALELFDVTEKVRVMSAIFENLGMVVFASQRASDWNKDDETGNALFSVLTKLVQDQDILPQECATLFDSFSASHVPHRDAFLATFRSAVGSRLIFLCMQRICAGLAKQSVKESQLSLKHIEEFSTAFTETLRDIFEGAESVSRVWEVTASLDSLASGPCRDEYRTELNRLLRTGAVPPPPMA